MGEHWTKKKGVISSKQAEAHAASKHRAHQIKQARKGKAPAPAYSEASGCLLALLYAPVLAVWRWLS